MNELAKRHEENSNLIKEIRASTNAAIRNQGASIKALEIQIGQMRKVLQERECGSLPSSTETNPRDHVNSILTTVETDTTLIHHRTVKHPKGIVENVLVGIGNFVFPVDFIILDMPEDINVPLILGRPFLSTVHAKIDVFKRKITLRLRRNRVDDLEPTVEEGEVVNEPMIDIVKNRCDFIGGLDDYPSNCDFDRRIHIDFVEDMDPYFDEGMGDVIVGEPFCKASCVEARRFDGIITIHDEDGSVTYQMDFNEKKSTTLVEYL
ncbi:putative reverse transcriptase domain-containing protein [Tanacetum coccineum]